jgi:hypothetical protein
MQSLAATTAQASPYGVVTDIALILSMITSHRSRDLARRYFETRRRNRRLSIARANISASFLRGNGKGLAEFFICTPRASFAVRGASVIRAFIASSFHPTVSHILYSAVC